MATPPAAVSVSLRRDESRSLPTQLADAIRQSIRGGTLRPDSRLPSTRALATELDIARGVVGQAYDQLTAEGWLVTRRGSGTFVVSASTLPRPAADNETAVSRRRVRSDDDRTIRLRPGVPWTDPRATAAWRRAWRTVGSRPAPAAYPDPAGLRLLRSDVCDLLARTRGTTVDPDRVVITTGAIHGMSLLLAAIGSELTEPVVAMENPGYRVAAAAARAARWAIADVPVDGHGMRVDLLERLPGPVHAVYVTPSHQYPTGGTLDLARRSALVDHARRIGALIVEDDYDSEFRFDVAPLPALAQLAPDRVVCLGTVAKTLGAGIRLGWMVLPDHLVDDVLTHRAAVGDFPSEPSSLAMSSLLRDGEWDRAVRAARRRYRDRDAAVERALSQFGELRGAGAGMHTTLMLAPERADAVAADAAEHGVLVPTVSESVRTPCGAGGLVVGYGRVEERDLTTALGVLSAALQRHR